jgi:hypothetical protein
MAYGWSKDFEGTGLRVTARRVTTGLFWREGLAAIRSRSVGLDGSAGRDVWDESAGPNFILFLNSENFKQNPNKFLKILNKDVEAIDAHMICTSMIVRRLC